MYSGMEYGDPLIWPQQAVSEPGVKASLEYREIALKPTVSTRDDLVGTDTPLGSPK